MNHGTASGPENRTPRRGFSTSAPLTSFASTVRGVLLQPAAFFREMDRRGGLSGPLVFALICSAISASLGYLLAPFNPLSPPGSGGGFEEIAGRLSGMGPVAGVLVSALVLAVALLVLVLYLYIGAAVYHVLVAILVQRHAGFDATFRVYAYTSAASLFSWIPLAGYLATLYSLYLIFVGVRTVHATTSARAALAAAIPAAVLLLAATVPLVR